MSAKRYENSASIRRSRRVRSRVKSTGRLRLSVFRSARHIYAQIIDDAEGKTLTTASSLDKEINGGGNRESAEAVGKLLGDRAVKAGINEVSFDRGSFSYHGRVKALAEGARAAGLKF